MPESENIDRLLRHSMTAKSAPTLSPQFEQRLANRLRPRRLSAKARYGLLGYSLLGIGASFAAMYATSMDWRLAGVSVLLPLGIAVALIRVYFRLPQ